MRVASMKQVFVAFDQFINTLWYFPNDGFGFADETISARSWRLREQSSLYKWINMFFFWQDNHCRGAYYSEMTRKQLPKEYTETTTS
jgi:hypothetical protein